MTEDGAVSEERTPLEAPWILAEPIAEALPELEPAFRRVARQLSPFLAYLYGAAGTMPGLNVAMTQATNDFVDVLFDLTTGRGRSALKGVRTLFELLVTVLDIKGNATLDARYYDHRWVAAQLESDLALEASLLPKKDRSADLHRRRKLKRDSQADYDRVVKAYGSGYARRWAADDLAARAGRHSLSHEYAFYRFASAVLHGTAGGAAGLETRIEGQTVFRTGPALALCPMAYIYAFHFFARIVSAVGESIGGPSVRDLKEALRDAKRLWPTYRREIFRLDRKMWPSTPVPSLIAVVGVRDGAKTWYLHNASDGLICEAEAPSVIPQDVALEELVRYVIEHAAPGELVTIGVFGVGVDAKKGATWMPDTEVLARVPEE